MFCNPTSRHGVVADAMNDLHVLTTATAKQLPATASSQGSRRLEEDRRVRLIIADPSEVYRIGVKSLLAHLDWVTVVGETVGEQGLEELLETARADLVLLEPSIAQTKDDEVRVIERVRALAPDVGLVVVINASHATMRRAIELGANACLTKTAGGEELAAALRLAANGRHYIQAELISPLLNGAPHTGLSPALSTQQLTILQLVSRGLKNEQIANEFGMSVTTVKSHLRLIYSLLAVSNRAQAAAAAVRLGIVS
jgi:DNA-binding NarL/FixJ family response regulator